MALPTHLGIPTEASLEGKKVDLLEIAATPIIHAISDSVLSSALLLPPFIQIPGALNLRDLGQIPLAKLKPGLIYRSGNLYNLPPSSIPLLSTQLQLSTVFDFRQIAERDRHPSPDLQGIRTVHLPSTAPPQRAVPKDFASNGGSDGYARFYDDFLKVYAEPYRTVLEYIRDREGEPILFHCTSGKDRTGILSAIILSLAGHTPQEVANDYVLSRIGVESQRIMLQESLIAWLGVDAMEQEGVLELASTRADNMIDFLEFMEGKYGGPIGYCRGVLGFSEEDLEIVKKNLVV